MNGTLPSMRLDYFSFTVFYDFGGGGLLVVPPSPEEANSDYAAKLRDLARRLELPSDYVERIR